MSATLLPGDMLVGYCGGSFGRDSYGKKRVEAVGADWIVARALEDDADPEFAAGADVHLALWPYCLRNPEYVSPEL